MTHIPESEKVCNMNRLLLILILTFSFQSWTMADDIRDFEIEGMSIGDSTLDFFTKSEITDNTWDYFTNKEFTPLQFDSPSFAKTYDAVDQGWNIGVVGLGAGALACYAKPQQAWTFYEIDPVVIEIAENPKYFSYLQRCTPKAAMVVGDARLSLQAEPAGKFDLLVIDAFSSDSVPTHLLTQEALQLYFSKLSANGVLAFHITNRHLELKKVLSDHAKQLHYAALIQEFKPKQEIPLVVATDWFVLAKNEKALTPLYQNGLGRWQKPGLYFDMKPWTDDFTNIVGIWK